MMMICDHSVMDQADTRRANLKRLVDELASGNATAFGRLVKRSQPMIADLLGGRKSFGEKVAASIEDALNLERGWLSTPNPDKIRLRRDTLSDQPGFFAAVGEESVEALHGEFEVEEDRRYHERRVGERRYTETLVIRHLAATGSMGAGLPLADFDHTVSSFTVDLSWLRQHVFFTAPGNLCLLDGRGDSMKGTFDDGDMLLVDKGITKADVDAVYVLIRDSELYIKRLQRLGGDRFLMISDNPVYRPIEIKINGDSNDFRVIARVVWAWNGRKL